MHFMSLKKIFKAVLITLLFSLQYCLLSADALVEYQMEQDKNGEIIDSSGNRLNSKFSGSIISDVKSNRKILRLNGKSDGVNIQNSRNINAADDMTYVAVVKFNNPMSAQKGHAHYDAVFYKHKQFVLSRRWNRFYCNFNDGHKWIGSMLSSASLKLVTGKWYFLALSFNFHNVPSQGEIWTTAKLYVNGKCVASKTVPYARPVRNKHLLQLGKADGFGKFWHLNGDVAYAAVFPDTLSSHQIQKLVLKEKLVKPEFEIPRRLNESQKRVIAELRKLVAQKKDSKAKNVFGALVDSVKNIPLTKNCKIDFARAAGRLKNILKKKVNAAEAITLWNRNNQIKTMVSESAVLSIAIEDNTFFLLGMNDIRTAREVFRTSSKLWELTTAVNGESYNFDSQSSGIKAYYKRMLSGSEEQGWSFSIKWEKSKSANNPCEFVATSNFTFKAGRLTYDLNAKSLTDDSLVEEVIFPSIDLKGQTAENAKLLVPIMSGVEYPAPLKSSASYSGYYPTGYCSMQMGAYYDNKSGIYFATEDPFASSKTLSYQANPHGIKVAVLWKNGANTFCSRSNAAFEIFKGNWYDAGIIYRKWLEKISPPWWTRELPRQDTAKWFRNNTLWIRFYNGQNSIQQLGKLREYFKLPFAVHWYSWWGDFDRDYPHFNPHPETYDALKELKSAGIRVVPYANGRLWETKDRRLEDWQFSAKGLPGSVKDSKGKAVIENYSGASFAVMCPASKIWKQVIYDITLNLPSFGFDGVYYDQIAAARPRFCYDKSHGHLLGDHDTWFMKGYYPMFQKIRKDLKREYPDAVLTSEDVSEAYAGIFDGMLPWRWMYDGQVPLFPLVYSGRVQFVGLSFGNETPAAKFPMLAKQLVNSEQLGWFSLTALNSSFAKKFLDFVKRSMHIRHAMLDFFNKGMMGRPINFKNKMQYLTLRWGRYGTGYVKTPVIVSNAWHYNNTTAFIMVNTTGREQKQIVSLGPDNLPVKAQKLQFHSFNTKGKYAKGTETTGFTRELRLAPYAAEVWIVADRSQNISSIVERFRKTFDNISGFINDKAPFEAKYSPTPPINAYKIQDAYSAPAIQGCIRQKERHAIGFIGRNSVIYFGTIDFGKKSPSGIEGWFAVSPKITGHNVKLVIDDLHKGKVIAEFRKLKSTGGWGDFKPVKVNLSRKVTGRHQVFMVFDGPNGMCNVKKWRAIK
jgi:hypothetical protein